MATPPADRSIRKGTLMPKMRVWIGGSKNLQPGDVVVGWSDSMSMLDKTLQVEREVPLPEVRVGDFVRYFWDTSSEIEQVAEVTEDQITFVKGGFIWRDSIYEVYRKVKES